MIAKKHETGSVHVVVTVVLVVALLGALGFIYWQNFVAKKSVATTTTASTQATTAETPAPAATTTTPTDTGKLVIKEWGVQLPVGSDYSYKVIDSTHIDIVSAKLKATEAAAGCTQATDGEDGTVDNVGQGSANSADYPSYAVKSPAINGHMYELNARSQGMCITSLGDKSAAYKQINDLYMTLHKELETAWPNMAAAN